MVSNPAPTIHHLVRQCRPSYLLPQSLQGRLKRVPSVAIESRSRSSQRRKITYTATCPPPTCDCAPMPKGLAIDHSRAMVMPSYYRHVVIRTGRDDWASRIEDDEASQKGPGSLAGNLAKALKDLVGPNGKYHATVQSVLITNSSIPHQDEPDTNSVLVFPQGLQVRSIRNHPEDIEAFVQQFLLPDKDLSVHDMGNGSPSLGDGEGSGISGGLEKTGDALRDENEVARQSLPVVLKYKRITEPRIFICAHGSRDSRCGILGSLLHAEFLRYQRLAKTIPEYSHIVKNWHIATISHIGGHVWAGNVIICIPKTYRLEDGTLSPLAGKSVWYGRVEPKHVEGILQETVQHGRVIDELLRGIHPTQTKISTNRV